MSDLRADAPAEVRFLFQESQKRSAGALAVSLGIHCRACSAWRSGLPCIHPSRPLDATVARPASANRSCGSMCPAQAAAAAAAATKSPEPVQKAELKGQGEDHRCRLRNRRRSKSPKRSRRRDPIQNLTIPAQTLASADLALAGAMEGIPTSDSLGLGRGGGAGTGQGTGIGSGRGSGLGEGWGGGTGGGAYRPGNGVETPRLLREVKPQYTAQAMRAKIQGEVLLECVVQPDGTVGNIRVRPLARFGVRPRSGSHQSCAPVAIRARHAAGPAGCRCS